MRYLAILLWLIICVACETPDNRKLNFPTDRESISELPDRNRLWIFFLAGQSNMAGRGFVEPTDTIFNERIFSLDENNKWTYAKEPLHYYEPDLTGLDCGLSFAKELLECVPDSVSIGLIPCAVGGSSISQWVNDEMHRGVKLLTNFRERLEAVEDQGIIKGILWHQGESDGNSEDIPKYHERATELFSKFREMTKNESLPIIIGELGTFMRPMEKQEKWDSINLIIHKGAELDENIYVISTKDLSHKGDNIHFDSKSQREIGKRFARKYCKIR